jgi:anti-sigma B factor antagonist
MMLETEVFKFEPDIIGISCEGRFTLGNRLRELEGLVNSLLEEGARKLVLDLTHVEFVDSAGLGVMMRISGEIEQKGGQLRIAGGNEQAHRLFDVTHTGTLLALDPDLVTSVRKLQEDKPAVDQS